MPDLTGQQLGQYVILSKLGEGGMASVYRARQASVNRDVAIKVIESKLAQNPEFLRRFEREARTLAGLDHPHILKIFDFGQQGDLLYLVMEIKTGGSLATLIEQGQLALPRVARLLDQIGDALDYAHSKGIIHRDLKPQNVLLDERGNAILTDFGIAKLVANDATQLTQSGMVMGTPSYMAPEQWKAGNADARTDFYALGIMLFEMISGRMPFKADTPAQMMYFHLQEPPPPIRPLRPDVPEAVEYLMQKALAKDPGARFQSGHALSEAFGQAMQGQLNADWASPTASTITPPGSPAASQAPRNRTGLIVFGVLVIVGLIAIVAVLLATRGSGVSPTSTPTVTWTSTSTSTPSATPTLTGTPSLTSTVTLTNTPRPTTAPIIVVVTATLERRASPTPVVVVVTATPLIIKTTAPAILESPVAPGGCPTYTVREGDTVALIAERYGVSITDLMAANGLDEASVTRLQIGQVLIVPVTGCLSPTKVPGTPSTPELILPRLNVAQVIVAGNLSAEGLEIVNASSALIDLTGWKLKSKGGLSYTFPNYRLFPQGRVVLYTRAGTNTPIALFLGQTKALWGDPSEVVTITNEIDQIQLVYPLSAGPAPTPTPLTGTPLVTANKQWTVHVKEFNGVKMVQVPPGCYMMGNVQGDTSQQPQTRICFESPFWIDQFEVTNIQFRTLGGKAINTSNLPGDGLPRDMIAWTEARDFCALRGARLPTEAEWEYAARGPDNLLYPWGAKFDPTSALYRGNATGSSGNVGSRPGGTSWVGAMDMSGNVWEWTSSLYKSYPYVAADGREDQANTLNERTLRGGSWNNFESALTTSYRRPAQPALVTYDIGFRCARDS